MKIIVLAGLAESLINFRGPLLNAFVKEGHDVLGSAPEDDSDIDKRLQRIGVRFYPVKLDRTGMNPIRDLFYFIQLVTLFRNTRPDIVFAYTIKPVIYGSLAARIAGVPLAFSMITGIGYSFMGQTLKQKLVNLPVRHLYRSALSGNKTVLFQNADDLRLFENYGLIKNNKRTVITNGSGIDLDHFAMVPAVVDRLIFLLIARLLNDKGIIEYVEAAKIVKQRYPQIVFRLLGPLDSNPSAIQKTQVDEWQRAGVIDYLGETSDVRPFIAECSVYVLPSYREGTPRTVLEAMAMGRPIVTTDVPGCRETVIKGGNGFLVPVKNVDALAQAMERFILQPELVEKMGRRSREIAEEKYDVHKVNAVIMKAMGLVNEKTV